MNPTMRKNAFLASVRLISAARTGPRFRPPVSLVMLSLSPRSVAMGPDNLRVEPGRQRGQRRVQVEGEVGVGPGGPAIVGRAAGGQGGPADGERVERFGRLAHAGRGEVADGPLPRVVVQGGAGVQGGHRAD